MAPTLSLHAALAVLLLAAAAPRPGAAWKRGRATFYGNEPWYWSIHHGSERAVPAAADGAAARPPPRAQAWPAGAPRPSAAPPRPRWPGCGLGYQWPDQGTGWNVAALADTHPDYRGSCGACYEVRCDSAVLRDGYGDSIDRTGACRDPEASVILKITDTCPCTYRRARCRAPVAARRARAAPPPLPRSPSHGRGWLARWLQEQLLLQQALVLRRHGVVPIEYRRVDCGAQPAKRAGGANFPGEFPPKALAGSRPGFDWHKAFPSGGYLNAHAGDGSKLVSVDDFLRMAGRASGGGGGGGGYAQFGK
ncbi:hypothetical protein HT031_000662 [Scenedesmus sp. PABB004]|nr:hypothetical protein HT031_000662 [Scenedesmus sp. PABB004]